MNYWYSLFFLIFPILWYFGNKSKYKKTKLPMDEPQIQGDFQKELNLLKIINEYLISVNLNKLKINSYGGELAQYHNNYLLKRNEVNHDFWRIREDNILKKGAISYGENIGYGSNNYRVLKGWIKSEKHYKTLVGDYTHIGISIINNYYTTIFIKK